MLHWHCPCYIGCPCCSQPVLLLHNPYCSSIARVAAAQPVLRQHSLSCSGTFRVAAAQPLLQLHIPCCSGTARVVAQPVLQWHSQSCSGTAGFVAAAQLCCSGTARVAAAQPLLQHYCLCCSSTARVAMAQPVLQHFSLVAAVQRAMQCLHVKLIKSSGGLKRDSLVRRTVAAHRTVASRRTVAARRTLAARRTAAARRTVATGRTVAARRAVAASRAVAARRTVASRRPDRDNLPTHTQTHTHTHTHTQLPQPARLAGLLHEWCSAHRVSRGSWSSGAACAARGPSCSGAALDPHHRPVQLTPLAEQRCSASCTRCAVRWQLCWCASERTGEPRRIGSARWLAVQLCSARSSQALHSRHCTSATCSSCPYVPAARVTRGAASKRREAARGAKLRYSGIFSAFRS